MTITIHEWTSYPDPPTCPGCSNSVPQSRDRLDRIVSYQCWLCMEYFYVEDPEPMTLEDDEAWGP